MIQKNKNVLILTSLIILLPVVMGLILPGYSFNVWISVAMPVFMLATHWFGIFITARDKNNEEQSQKVLNMVLWIVPIISLIVSGISISVATENKVHIDMIVKIILGVVFVILGNYMPKCKPNYTIGIRVTWSLQSEENWIKTHRFTGKLWVAGGIFSLVTISVSMENFMFIYLVVILLMAFAPMLYSYIYYKKQLKRGTVSKDDKEAVAQNSFSKNTTAAGAVFGIIVAAGALIFAFTGKYEINIEESAFTIDATYWHDTTVKYADITDIEYRDELVPGNRTYGYGSPSMIMGECENKEFGNHTRYAYDSCDACIVITIDKKKLVVNEKDVEKTKQLYDEILKKCNH